MATNLNWPLLQVLWSPTSNGVYDTNTLIYTDITWRAITSWAVSRGRQYELDQMVSGTYTALLDNRDGAFNPVSTSSVFAGSVLPYRQLQVRAQWPPTANLLTGDQATAGEATPIAPGAIPAALNIGTDVGATLTIAASGTAWQGTQVYQAVVPGAVTVNFFLIKVVHLPVQAPSIATSTLTYTWSTYVRCTTGGTNPSVAAAIKWHDATGATVSTTTGSTSVLTGGSSASWTRVTVSGPVPTGAVYATAAVAMKGTPPASPWTLQMDGLQFETAAAASTWAEPNTWYPIYTGGVERYPNQYDLSGTRASVPITTTDAFALLPQSLIPTAYVAEILRYNPNFLYELAEPAGSTAVADSTGNRMAAPVQTSPTGAGSLVFGTPVTSTNPADGFVGTPGPVATFNNNSTVSTPVNPETFISLGAVATVPGPPVTGAWTRILSFRAPAAPATGSDIFYLWDARANTGAGFQEFFIAIDGSLGNLFAGVADATNAGPDYIGGSNICDGNWHHVAVVFNTATLAGSVYLDGVSVATGSCAVIPAGFTSDVLGCAVQGGSKVYFGGAKADVALCVEVPSALSSPQILSLYNTWRSADTGDSSDQRASRILQWVGFTGPTALDAGDSTSLGPATDVNGLDGLSALQNVTDTEGGEQFIARDGTYTFYNRDRRLSAATPVVVFGENTSAGEIPYEDLQFDFDPTIVENDVTITQVESNQNFYALNPASQLTYGTRSYQKSNQSTFMQEVQDQADWFASTFGYPKLRAASITIHPAANPALLWPVCLSMELGQYVQVNRRPMGSTVGALDEVTLFGFVENIAWSANNGADATLTMQISPAVGTGGGPSQVTAYPWNLALLHTTIHSTALSGQPTITIDALPTSAFSTLDQNLVQGGPGQLLTIGSGLGTQETLTIASVSATSLGYTTATITFTGNLAHTHNPGEIVRETLGLATASGWQNLDSHSALDSALITY